MFVDVFFIFQNLFVCLFVGFCFFSQMHFRRKSFNQKSMALGEIQKTNLEARGPIERYLVMK